MKEKTGRRLKNLIITIFTIFLIITLTLIITGKILKQPPLTLAGFLFLFILGLVLLLGGLEYVSGTTEAYNYTCACCENGTYHEGNITEYYTYSCLGTPNDCDYYDGNLEGCVINGCTYDSNLSLCSGTPHTCENYLNQRDCEAVTCEWLQDQEPSVTEGCTNGSITLKSTSKQNIYSNYDSEIIQGVQVNHIIGLFLSLIAIAGFIITLTNLESFQQEDAYKEYRGGQP